MSETMHKLTMEILKVRYDFKNCSNKELHTAYREIYDELQKLDLKYAKDHPGMKILK